VKKSLEAKVALYGANDAAAGFSDEELATLFLVSQVVRVEDPANARITVEAAEGQKCVRCWLIKRDIGTDPAHPEVCARCAAAVTK
jgi:isoleucyl-tRNA synthetase